MKKSVVQLARVPLHACLEAVGSLQDQHEALDGTADAATMRVFLWTLNKLLEKSTEN